MAGIGKFFSDAARLLYLGVGISDPGTIPRKIDLWKIASGENWKLFNCSAAKLHYKGKEAVNLKAGEGGGLVLYNALELSFCKIDLSIAAINQSVGVIFHAESETGYDRVLLSVQARTEAGRQGLRLIVDAGSKTSEVELPAHLLEEWIAVRIVVDPNFTAVFVSGNNMPCLKVPAVKTAKLDGKIGLSAPGNSEALVADLKYIQTRKRDFE